MIDWLTLAVPVEAVDPETVAKLSRKNSLVMCINPDGNIEWQKPQRRSIRSDSHQITVEVCGSVRIYGSPSRVALKSADNVFGSQDIRDCASRMIGFVESIEQVELPGYPAWSCSRIDVTHNYAMGSLANVKEALGYLRHAEGGRYQVKTDAESVYWSTRSTVKSGKAYAKGAHMRYLEKRGKSFLTPEQLELTQGLLRLELGLRRHYLSRQLNKPWHELTAGELDSIHESYFSQLIGDIKVTERTDLLRACKEAAERIGLSQGIGKAAFMSWTVIQSQGFRAWEEMCPRSTFYRHKKVLREAGLSYADFAARNVVPLRKRQLTIGQPVRSWSELRAAA